MKILNNPGAEIQQNIIVNETTTFLYKNQKYGFFHISPKEFLLFRLDTRNRYIEKIFNLDEIFVYEPFMGKMTLCD